MNVIVLVLKSKKFIIIYLVNGHVCAKVNGRAFQNSNQKSLRLPRELQGKQNF